VYKHHHAWTNSNFGGKLPSEVFRERFLNCFIDDKAGVEMRHHIGIETIMWECDYPHSDTTWPNAPEILWESVKNVPEAEVHAMTWQNAVREFRYKFAPQMPKEKATVGELRKLATHVDLSLSKGLGGNPAAGAGEVVTAQHIVNQLANAFVKQ
jgi:hypothetical protein